MATRAPKLFVSYSWSSEEHERWVIVLATALREAGVDVLLDKWDLREGHDAYKFMEQMVADPTVRKVVIVCDKKYVEKADGRSGGVGAETQILSPEIYSQHDQGKFVAVIAERDDHGKPYVPAYYKSRIYIDLSEDALYARNFEQLLRWVFDKPLYVKPALGEPPAFLSESAGTASLGTTVLFQRVIDAIRCNRSHRNGALNEYFDRLSSGLETLRITAKEGEFDDQVVSSIEQFLPYRNEATEVFLSLAQHGLTPDDERSLHRFFERLLPYLNRPEAVTSWNEWHVDNYRFLVHELFLYCIASLLRYERFDAAAQILRQPYFVGDPPGAQGAVASFAVVHTYMRSFEYRKQRLNLRRLSLRADLLRDRAAAAGLRFDQLMQADLTLYIRDCLDALREGKDQRWWPETLLFVQDRDRPFEIYARAQSRRYFDSLRCLFDIESSADLETLVQAYKEGRLRIPRWEFESFNPLKLLGNERIATRP